MDLPDWRLHSKKKVLYLDFLVINAPDGKSVNTDGLFQLPFDVYQVSLGPEFVPGIVQVGDTLATDSPRRTSIVEQWWRSLRLIVLSRPCGDSGIVAC